MRTLARALLVLSIVAIPMPPSPSQAAWVPEGNPLCNVLGYQYPVIAARAAWPLGPAGPVAHGMFVVWQDSRDDPGDVYGGVVNDVPPPDPAPGTDGMPLVVAPDNQGGLAVAAVLPVPNGSQAQGPAFIVLWLHGPDYTLRAKRVGDAEDWGPLGVVVRQSQNFTPFQATLTGDGGTGAIIAWQDANAAQRLVRAQHVDAQGNLGWGPTGVPVGLDTTVQGKPEIAPAPGGGAYILRTDRRNGGSLASPLVLVLYRLDASGGTAAGWPAAGVVLGDQSPNGYKLLADGTGGVYAAWREQEPLSDSSLGVETRVTRIGPDGLPVAGWTLAGIDAVARSDGHRSLDDVDLDGTGGVVLVVEYDRVVGGPAASGTDLVVQRLLADGTRPAGWPAAGHTISDAGGPQREARLIGQHGGLLAAWRDERSGESDLYCSRLEPDGTLAEDWVPDGLLLSGAFSTQSGLQMAPNNSGGAVFVWHDWRDFGTGPDLFMQTVNAFGELDAPRPSTPTGSLELSAPVPSPARHSVELTLKSGQSGDARVHVLDAMGRIVDEWSLPVGPGSTMIRWDLRDARGRPVAPGVYHLRVNTMWGKQSRRIVVHG